jgi:hypothetical protein
MPVMNLAVHMHFLDSLAVLSKQDQARTRAALGQLANGETGAGLRKHKVAPRVSISPTMSLRVIGVARAGVFTAVHVDQHDAAYAWGTRHRPQFYDDGTLVAVLPRVDVMLMLEGASLCPVVA